MHILHLIHIHVNIKNYSYVCVYVLTYLLSKSICKQNTKEKTPHCSMNKDNIQQFLSPLRQCKNFQVIIQQVFIEFPEFSYKCKKQKRSIMPTTQFFHDIKKKNSKNIYISVTQIFTQKATLFPKINYTQTLSKVSTHVYSQQ